MSNYGFLAKCAAILRSFAWRERYGIGIAKLYQPMTVRNPSDGAAMHVLIVSQNAGRSRLLEQGVRAAGYDRLSLVADLQNLMRRIVELDPSVIAIDLEKPSRDVLIQMFGVSRCARRPVALFVEESATDMIEAAVDAGVGAYVVGALDEARIKVTLDLAISRFRAFEKLRTELERVQAELDERKVIERAKGLLMRERGLSEQDAYGLMRKAAMNENRRVGEVAQSVLTAASLLR